MFFFFANTFERVLMLEVAPMKAPTDVKKIALKYIFILHF